MNPVIIQIWPEKFEIDTNDGKSILAPVRGSLKKSNKLMVGDFVNIEKQIDNSYIITKLLSRKNMLVRPPVANIDSLICIISNTTPVPDLLVLDKLLIMAKHNNIIPTICINKCDLELSNISKYIIETYSNIGYTVLKSIAKNNENGDISAIHNILENKISILAGGSGVGKTSIINAIFPEIKGEIGQVNDKINRGKHTTKYTRLYKICNGYIADTPGFSAFDIIENIKKEELKTYYNEYLTCNCKYYNCNHINENIEECEIKRKVKNGLLDQSRYERYLKIFNEINIKEKTKYI